jgi:hypothetical protein
MMLIHCDFDSSITKIHYLLQLFLQYLSLLIEQHWTASAATIVKVYCSTMDSLLLVEWLLSGTNFLFI